MSIGSTIANIASSVGFVRSLLAGLQSPNPRFVLVEAVDQQGQQLLALDGSAIYQLLNTYVALSEDHYHEMTITDHPVEQGSVISDHAYRMPRRLTMRLGWSPSTPGAAGADKISAFGVTLPTLTGFFGINDGAGLAFIKALMQALVDLQMSRALLTIFTGKFIYNNMLLQSIQEATTRETENVLMVNLVFRELMIATVTPINSPVNGSPLAQSAPSITGPDKAAGSQSLQPAPAFNQLALPPGVNLTPAPAAVPSLIS